MTLHVGYSRLYPASLTFTAALTKREGGEKQKILLYSSSSRGSMVCDSTASEMALPWHGRLQGAPIKTIP